MATTAVGCELSRINSQNERELMSKTLQKSGSVTPEVDITDTHSRFNIKDKDNLAKDIKDAMLIKENPSTNYGGVES